MPAETREYRSKLSADGWRYPASSAFDRGHLTVGGGPHRIYWEQHGHPGGEPVFVIHGGPGGGSQPAYARFFDPARYRVVLFDQRGCGRSEPNAASDPQAALQDNTTADLIADIEALYAHFGLEGRVHLFGGSWGSTLALAYAIAHPERVASLVLRGIFLGRRQDIDFFYQGNAATYDRAPRATPVPGTYIAFPEPWEHFVETIPVDERGDMVKAYAEIFAGGHDEERVVEAARAWSVWEGSTSYLAQDTRNLSKHAEPSFAKAFARIENHYFMNGCFLGGSGEANRDQNYIIERVDRLRGIHVSIVHGRYDQVCSLSQAFELADAMEAEGISVDLRIPPAGHSMLERETYRELADIMVSLPTGLL